MLPPDQRSVPSAVRRRASVRTWPSPSRNSAPWSVATSLAPDLRVYLFLAGVGVVAGVLFGVMPSWAVARADVARARRAVMRILPIAAEAATRAR